MNVLVDSAGVVQAVGTCSFVVPTGCTILPLADGQYQAYQDAANQAAAASSPSGVHYDGTAFTVVVITLPPDAADIDDIRKKARYALAIWDTLTAAQKDTALKACVRFLARELG